MTPFWEKVWFFLGFIFMGSSYLSPRAYGIMHRMHHSFADTEFDPHSPKYSKGLLDMMMKTKDKYVYILAHQDEYEAKYKVGLPNWPFMDWFADLWGVRIFWGLAYIAFYVVFAEHWWQYLLLPIHFVMGPVHGAIINWFAHKIGYINFKVNDTATNLLPVDVLMLGESYHNNHHKFGGRPNFGVRWHEIDPVYPFIRLFHALGMIKLRRAPETEYM